MDNSKPNKIKLEYIGKAIRHLRKQKGMTIEDFTGESDINAKYISKIENGKRNITLTTFFKVCQGLDIEPSNLHDIAEEMERRSK